MRHFFILQGVRRAVAADRAGWTDIAAVVHDPGTADLLTRVPLDELYTGKSELVRDGRYIRNTEYPTVVLGTQPPPITVQPISAKRAARLTPIRSVRLI